mmetsp:Transcript_9051/g.13237  ORF Transcript_9051/g.13237 Transcript_9051/m.13237 type:complete len:101 (+) Transcript_9051:341-643(+)
MSIALHPISVTKMSRRISLYTFNLENSLPVTAYSLAHILHSLWRGRAPARRRLQSRASIRIRYLRARRVEVLAVRSDLAVRDLEGGKELFADRFGVSSYG